MRQEKRSLVRRNSYLRALDVRGIAADGLEFHLIAEPADFAASKVFWFAKSSHAEHVAIACRADTVGHEPADIITNAAAVLAVSFIMQTELLAIADQAIAAIERSADDLRVSGGLAALNAEYKGYRQSCIGSGERALPYAAFLERFILRMIELAGATMKTAGTPFATMPELPAHVRISAA